MLCHKHPASRLLVPSAKWSPEAPRVSSLSDDLRILKYFNGYLGVHSLLAATLTSRPQKRNRHFFKLWHKVCSFGSENQHNYHFCFCDLSCPKFLNSSELTQSLPSNILSQSTTLNIILVPRRLCHDRHLFSGCILSLMIDIFIRVLRLHSREHKLKRRMKKHKKHQHCSPIPRWGLFDEVIQVHSHWLAQVR
jgi:hypothetical protein